MTSPDWTPLAELIENSESFLLTSHLRPDADALGSELGLACLLEEMGKTVHIINASAPPANLRFMNTDGRILKLGDQIRLDSVPETDAIIIVDTSAWQQIGGMAEVIRRSEARLGIIDHHVSSDTFDAVIVRETGAAATGELIYDLGCHLNQKPNPAAATALYAAIATDTGWFRFPSTTARTMRTAADLIELGAEPHVVYNLVNEQRSLARVRLAGRVLGQVRHECEGRLIWIQADRNDLRETSAVPADTESLVNECLKIAGSEAAFIAVELPSSMIKFSLRSRPPHDVAALASQFGGGGHKLASGLTLPGPLAEAVEKVRSGFVAMLSESFDSSENTGDESE